MKKVKLLFILTLIFTINIYGQESDYVKPIDRSVQPKQGKTPTIDLKEPAHKFISILILYYPKQFTTNSYPCTP